MAGTDGARVPSLGPRLLGRLTADLVMRSPQFLNAIREYELDLRGNKIGAIENLGVTENQFDCIDLTDNAIVVLDGFPSLPRLSMLLLNNNRISRISVANLERSLPRLETLVLTNNRISRIEDVEALGRLKSLRHLSLIDNPVTKLRFYRSSVIHAVPQLRWLDFARVRQGERKLAQDLHKKGEIGARVDGEFVPGEGVPEVMGPPADEDMAGAGAEERGEAQPAGGKRALTAEESTALRAMIANATTVQEVEELERALRMGEMPASIRVGQENGEHGEAMET